jgi:hypothetical protein
MRQRLYSAPREQRGLFAYVPQRQLWEYRSETHSAYGAVLTGARQYRSSTLTSASLSSGSSSAARVREVLQGRAAAVGTDATSGSITTSTCARQHPAGMQQTTCSIQHDSSITFTP